MIFEKKLLPVTQEMLRKYASASGDPNPIHLDEEVAKENGLPGVIAHGMLVAGWLCTYLEEAKKELGLLPYRIQKFQTRFRGMVFLGDTVNILYQIKSSGENIVTLDIVAKNQKGETVNTGQAVFVN